MKQRILIIIALTLLCFSSEAQNARVKKAFDNTPATALPFYNSYQEGLDYRTYYFPTEEVKDKLDTRLWTDLQLTKYTDDSDFQFESLGRVFIPTNGNYRLGLVAIGAGEYYKDLLITAKEDGTVIDALEVGAQGGSSKYSWLTVKQFSIDNNMNVVVYQIKPTSGVSLPFETTQTSFTGQRIDTAYKIDSNGKFQKISETLYNPKTYTFGYLEYGKNIFRDGGEARNSDPPKGKLQPDLPKDPDPQYPVPYEEPKY